MNNILQAHAIKVTLLTHVCQFKSQIPTTHLLTMSLTLTLGSLLREIEPWFDNQLLFTDRRKWLFFLVQIAQPFHWCWLRSFPFIYVFFSGCLIGKKELYRSRTEVCRCTWMKDPVFGIITCQTLSISLANHMQVPFNLANCKKAKEKKRALAFNKAMK